MNFKITLDDLIKVNPDICVVIRKGRLAEIKDKIRKEYRSFSVFSKNIGISRNFLSKIIYGDENPNIHSALRIILKLNLKIKDSIEKIVLKARPNGSFIHITSFPINATPELASLVGRSFGDGHIGSPFEYTNTSQELIDDVITKVHKLPVERITMNQRFHKAHEVRFSKLVRDILVVAGAPKGNKVKENSHVPQWIKTGSSKIKRAFLQSLFDDEGSVIVKKREITLCFVKNVKLQKNLDNFLSEIKLLLNELDINGVTVTKGMPYSGKNGNTIPKILRVCGVTNFIKFKENVDFVHPRKKKLLDAMIENTKIIKMNRNERNEMIINILKNNPMLNAHQIAKMTGMSHKGTLNKLNELESESLISRTKNPIEAYFQHKPSFKWFLDKH